MNKTRLITLAGALLLGFLGTSTNIAAADTLDTVRKRGEVICGIHGSRAGFSNVDSQGRWQGLDIDTCRAIAAAVLGDPDKTRYVRTTNQTRFPALQSGELDVLTNNVTWTLTRDTSLGFDFGAVYFFDAQGFMVPRSLNAKSVKDLDGATVCVLPGSTSEKVVADVFRRNNLRFTPVLIEKPAEMSAAFFSGRCDVNVQAVSGLSAQRAVFASNHDDWIILPERYGKDPMAVVVRHGDNAWKDIVTWVVHATIEAEELGLDRDNVKAALNSDDPQIRRLLGVTPGIGKTLGLDEQWAYRVIEAVGNHGEIYERNLGKNSVLKLERGQNRLSRDGGLIHSPPFN